MKYFYIKNDNDNNNKIGGGDNNSNNDMYNIGIKHGSDKFTNHGYDRFYDFFFKNFKNKKIKLLEIGINKGESLNAWEEYFGEGSKIYGLDKHYINDKYKKQNIEYIKGDQNNKKDLDKIIKIVKECEIIIDDGSHHPHHQLFSFNYLFDKLLKKGGIYVIEDIETSYWRNSSLYNYEINEGVNSENNIVNIFKKIINIVNRKFMLNDDVIELEKNSQIDIKNLKYISFIMFAQNCIIINKMTDEEYKKYYTKEYIFKENL
jgi:hypothetical protein